MSNSIHNNISFEQIGNALGLSKATVSRALSGKGRISAETVERVNAYVRYLNSRKLRQDRNSICVVMPADAYIMKYPYFNECLLGISQTGTLRDYNIQLTTGNPNDITNVQRLVEHELVDGIILMRSMKNDSVLQYLEERSFPSGLTGECDSDKIIQVDSDARTGSEKMTTMLIERGYRRFAVIVGDCHFKVNSNRLDGFFDAIDNYRLPRGAQHTYEHCIETDLVDSIIKDILSKKVECIICGDELICTWVMYRMQAIHVRIPQEITLVSLYDSPYLEFFNPAVTALSISAQRMGAEICTQMINYIEGLAYTQKTMIEPEIIVRKSTGSVMERR